MSLNTAFRFFKDTREYLTPVLTQTFFHEKGMLTPEEFVRAGDHLVRMCPSWRWEAGEKAKARPYLPPTKQYLVTKGVPSYSRAITLQASQLVEENVQGGMGEQEGAWCAPALVAASSGIEDEVLVQDSDFMDEAEVEKLPRVVDKAGEKTQEYEDMEDESLALDYIATYREKEAPSDFDSSPIDGDGLVRARRYDVSITYDNYYRVPRIWLFGHKEDGSGLSTQEVYQDVMQDYAKKTVTVEPHPHLSSEHASVHPCQHAAAMLSILAALKETGNMPTVDQYLFFFLKFIQSVVPTIEYDYTTEVKVS